MEAHSQFVAHNFGNVSSFGTNGRVKLPGPAPDQPIVFEFGITYEDIYNKLKSEDEALYSSKGLLMMLERNMKVKPKPERFQETQKRFEIIITFEERVMDIVVEVLNSKDPVVDEPVHVFNLDVVDNHESAVEGAKDARALAMLIDKHADEWEDKVDDIISEFTEKHRRRVLHSVCFY